MDREERERLRFSLSNSLLVKTTMERLQAEKAELRRALDACERRWTTCDEERRELLIANEGLSRERDDRCHVTGNPVGTDTWMAGEGCKCLACRLMVAERERDEARIAVEQTFAVNRALKGTNERLAAEFETMEEDAHALVEGVKEVRDRAESGFGEKDPEALSVKLYFILDLATRLLARPSVRRLLEEKGPVPVV